MTKAYIGPDPSLAEQAKEAAREVGDALGAAAGAAADAASAGLGGAVGAFWKGIPTPVKLGLGAVAVLIVFNQVRALSPKR